MLLKLLPTYPGAALSNAVNYATVSREVESEARARKNTLLRNATFRAPVTSFLGLVVGPLGFVATATRLVAQLI